MDIPYTSTLSSFYDASLKCKMHADNTTAYTSFSETPLLKKREIKSQERELGGGVGQRDMGSAAVNVQVEYLRI